jgi:hypothetical protein
MELTMLWWKFFQMINYAYGLHRACLAAEIQQCKF